MSVSQSVSESEATPTRPAFDRWVEAVKPCKTYNGNLSEHKTVEYSNNTIRLTCGRIAQIDINFVVMDYLVNEGFPEAAKKFAVEANIQRSPGDTDHIEERVEIRNAILSGNIQSAIEKINDLAPELLEDNTTLHFFLLRLQLIELIRTCTSSESADIMPALDFATTHLAPLAPTNPTFLSDLERTMALLIFPPDNLTPQLQALLNPELRTKVAERVNEALLEDMGCAGVAKLRGLVRLRAWAERRARERHVETSAAGLDLWGTAGGSVKRESDGAANGTGDISMGA